MSVARAIRIDGKFAGKERLERIDPGTHKTCARCKQSKPVSYFRRDSRSRDGLTSYCQFCKAEYERLRYQRLQKQRKEEKWESMQPWLLKAAVADLLDAALEARTAGMWRGSEAIRAYARLGEVLAKFNRDHEVSGEHTEPDWNESMRKHELQGEDGLVFFDADSELFGDDA